MHFEKTPFLKDKLIRFDRGILIDLENCLSSFVGMLLGPCNLPTLNVLIISSVSSGVVGLKKKVFLDSRGIC